MGGRAVEGTGLENRQAREGLVGSNPTPSARARESGGLIEEAREATLETILLLGRALAVENCVPEPAELNEALKEPLSLYWGEVLPAISEFATVPSSPATQLAQKLQKIADSVAL